MLTKIKRFYVHVRKWMQFVVEYLKADRQDDVEKKRKINYKFLKLLAKLCLPSSIKSETKMHFTSKN